MEKTENKPKKSSVERKMLIVFSVIFIGVLAGGWISAMLLRQTLSAGHSVVNVDVRALIEIERFRNLAESQIANSRSYFLLGSKALYHKQKKDQEAFLSTLTKFET